MLCATLVITLSFINTELTKVGLDSDSGQQVVTLCTNDSGTLRPKNSNIHRIPLSTASYTPLPAQPEQLQLSSVNLRRHHAAAYVPDVSTY